MPRAVALVSDSTSVHAELAQRLDVIIVPLQVIIGTKAYDEGSGASPETVAAALKARTPVSTSRPSPEAFLRVYERASKDGADAVVSVHLSSEVSGTFDSAELAARRASIPVYVVDSRQLGMATGFAVQSAAEALDRGADAEEAAAVASSRAAAMTALFYVDTLEHLRRGGRVGTTAALLGSALAVKPLLKVEDGCIVALEKVRTSAKALNRMQELAVAAAGDEDVDVAVSHLANAAGAEALASQLKERLPQLDHVVVTQVGAVIGAHVGPGMLAVVVAPRQPQRLDEATDSAQEDDSG
ncbi:MAG: DegV family protein [Actinomycetota bacterium]|nr:DegV family protein [Nocardioidaceae bacterium]MDQ3480182.1 DegV family protein [Actinomycetota bacterium]